MRLALGILLFATFVFGQSVLEHEYGTELDFIKKSKTKDLLGSDAHKAFLHRVNKNTQIVYFVSENGEVVRKKSLNREDNELAVLARETERVFLHKPQGHSSRPHSYLTEVYDESGNLIVAYHDNERVLIGLGRNLFLAVPVSAFGNTTVLAIDASGKAVNELPFGGSGNYGVMKFGNLFILHNGGKGNVCAIDQWANIQWTTDVSGPINGMSISSNGEICVSTKEAFYLYDTSGAQLLSRDIANDRGGNLKSHISSSGRHIVWTFVEASNRVTKNYGKVEIGVYSILNKADVWRLDKKVSEGHAFAPIEIGFQQFGSNQEYSYIRYSSPGLFVFDQAGNLVFEKKITDRTWPYQYELFVFDKQLGLYNTHNRVFTKFFTAKD